MTRYRVTIWFDADFLGAAERYAADLVELWDSAKHAGVTRLESQLSVEKHAFEVHAEPIMRRDQLEARQGRDG